MFHFPFRPSIPRFPILLSLLLIHAGGCAFAPETSAPAEGEQAPVREDTSALTSALEEELQDLQRRVEFLEDRLAPGKKIEPAPPARTTQPAPARPKATPAPPAASVQTPAPASPVPSPSATGQPGTLPAPYSPPPSSPGPAPETSPETGLPIVSSTSGTPLPRVAESTPATPVPNARPAAAPARTEQNAYDMALGLYRTGRFAQAEAAFQAFLESYPNSRLTANALYWKGETFYSRGMLSDAIFAFKDVQARFPRHPKTPDSLLKTAMAYAKLGDRQNAELHLTVLREDWPKSEAAAQAKKLGLF